MINEGIIAFSCVITGESIRFSQIVPNPGLHNTSQHCAEHKTKQKVMNMGKRFVEKRQGYQEKKGETELRESNRNALYT